MAVEIIEKELSYRVVRCVFDVHNEVGPGIREECYQKAMEQRLREEGLPFEAKPKTRRELIHHGIVCHIFEPDLVIADRLIAEASFVCKLRPCGKRSPLAPFGPCKPICV